MEASNIKLNLTAVGSKRKYTRKPWVYASEYNRLQTKYKILKYVALLGWVLLALSIKVFAG